MSQVNIACYHKSMNDIPPGFYRTSIKALILDSQNKFLLSKEDNGYWDFPGGALDYGELPSDCLRRELAEEMGLVITHIDDNPSYFFSAQKKNGVWITNIFYKVEVKDLNITPSDECIEVRFFTINEALKENMFPTFAEFVKVFKS